ncbi:hypothetical protein [Chryseobacterium gregarium]|uniref:hypothetical protein n=1 Tax=Chryseobacterium gregarium TaxID=456299 RepID=UPI000687F784|nr:hypothetical protein [Chryseobacterium gregarium]
MFSKTFFTTFLLLSVSVVKAQQIIPFWITTHNNIIVKALVNYKDSPDLMFQIAMEDASISPERQRKADPIIFSQKISKKNTVRIGPLTIDNVRFWTMNLQGRKLGTGIFAGKTFKIDYDHNRF